MESFSFEIERNTKKVKILVIPDECLTYSIFHLIVEETELAKIKYTDTDKWQVIEGEELLTKEELKVISSKIEEHFL